MTNQKTKLNKKINPYLILILGCILSSLLIFNSNLINTEKNKYQLYKEKSRLFDKIISIRKLDGETPEDNTESPTPENEENSKTEEGTDKVCQKGSESLVEYYKTGDLSKIELEEGNIECKEKDKGYFKALLNIIQKMTSEKDGEGKNSRNLQGINFDEIQDDTITYVKHIIPIALFLVIALFSIPGWLICCLCSCCNCCCC